RWARIVAICVRAPVSIGSPSRCQMPAIPHMQACLQFRPMPSGTKLSDDLAASLEPRYREAKLRVGVAAASLHRRRLKRVTTIGGDHYKLFRTLDATAAEKRALLAEAAEDATAVLNADDPRALGMAAGFHGPVITFGSSPGATLQALDIRAAWPERLSFTL